MKKILFGTKKHRGLLAYLLIILLAFGSSGIYLYPAVQQKQTSDHQGEVRITYETSVGSREKEINAEEWSRAELYNFELREGKISDPFLGAEQEDLPEEYLGLLNVDGVMGVIEYPALGISLPIYHGTGEEALERGIGHLWGSSLPVGGRGTHAVLVGHNGLPNARMFDDLEKAGVGDVFCLRVLGHELTYKVEQIQVVLPEEIEFLTIAPEEDRVTLMTCTPYGENTHRLLVSGIRQMPEESDDQPADDGSETLESESRVDSPTRKMLWQRIAVCCLVICGLVLLLILTEPRSNKNPPA